MWEGLACLFILVYLGLSLGLFLDWIRWRYDLGPYFGSGLRLAALAVGLEVVALGMVLVGAGGIEEGDLGIEGLLLPIQLGFDFVKVFGIATLGMYLAAKLELPSFLLRGLRPSSPSPAGSLDRAVAEGKAAPIGGGSGAAVGDGPSELARPGSWREAGPAFSWRSYLLLCAETHRAPLLTLDRGLQEVARRRGIQVVEI